MQRAVSVAIAAWFLFMSCGGEGAVSDPRDGLSVGGGMPSLPGDAPLLPDSVSTQVEDHGIAPLLDLPDPEIGPMDSLADSEPVGDTPSQRIDDIKNDDTKNDDLAQIADTEALLDDAVLDGAVGRGDTAGFSNDSSADGDGVFVDAADSLDDSSSRDALVDVAARRRDTLVTDLGSTAPDTTGPDGDLVDGDTGLSVDVDVVTMNDTDILDAADSASTLVDAFTSTLDVATFDGFQSSAETTELVDIPDATADGSVVAADTELPSPQHLLVEFRLDLSLTSLNAQCVPHVLGNFNDWQWGATPMSDDDGDGLWQVQVLLPAEATYYYRFSPCGPDSSEALNATEACAQELVGMVSRVLTLGLTAPTLPAVCPGSCLPCPGSCVGLDDGGEAPETFPMATHLDAAHQVEVVTWNLRQFPQAQMTTDYVRALMNSWRADIYVLQEIQDEEALVSMVASLGDYDYVLSEEAGNTDFAVVYKTVNSTCPECGVVSLESRQELWADTQASPDDDDDYTNNARYQFADRPPLEVRMTWSAGDFSVELFLIATHYKCCGASTYDPSKPHAPAARRHYASLLLTDYVQSHRAEDRVVILGDFNNVGVQSLLNTTLAPFGDPAFPSAANFQVTDGFVFDQAPWTWSWQGWTSSYDAKHFDHIIINKPLIEVSSGSVAGALDMHAETGMSCFAIDGLISDHQPVYYRFIPILDSPE